MRVCKKNPSGFAPWVLEQFSQHWSSKDGSKGWPGVVVSREQHVQDDYKLEMAKKGCLLDQEVAIFQWKKAILLP